MDGQTHVAEVHYFMLLHVGMELHPVALLSLYGPPHQQLLEASSGTYWTAQHLHDSDIRVVDVKAINAVVMMAPDPRYPECFQDGTQTDRWYLMEKPGLKLSQMMGIEEVAIEE